MRSDKERPRRSSPSRQRKSNAHTHRSLRPYSRFEHKRLAATDGPGFTAVASQGSWRWRRYGFSATAFPRFGGIRFRRSKLMKPVLTATTLAMGLGLAVPAVAQAQPNDPGRTSPLAQTEPGKASSLARSPCSTLAQAAPRDAGRESPLVAQAAPRDAGRESPLVAQGAPRDPGKESALASADEALSSRDTGKDPLASADEGCR